IVVVGVAVTAQRALSVLSAEADAGLDDGGKHQNSGGVLDKLARAANRPIKAAQGSIDVGVDDAGRGRVALANGAGNDGKRKEDVEGEGFWRHVRHGPLIGRGSAPRA